MIKCDMHQHILIGQDKKISLYDIKSAKIFTSYIITDNRDKVGDVISIAVDSSGSFIACSTQDKFIRILDYLSGQSINKTRCSGDIVTKIKFTSDGSKLICVSGDSCIYI